MHSAGVKSFDHDTKNSLPDLMTKRRAPHLNHPLRDSTVQVCCRSQAGSRDIGDIHILRSTVGRKVVPPRDREAFRSYSVSRLRGAKGIILPTEYSLVFCFGAKHELYPNSNNQVSTKQVLGYLPLVADLILSTWQYLQWGCSSTMSR
jgi:hypothetical protein